MFLLTNAENIWEEYLFFGGGGGEVGRGEGGRGKEPEERSCRTKDTSTVCMLSISQVQGNLIRVKKKSVWMY